MIVAAIHSVVNSTRQSRPFGVGILPDDVGSHSPIARRTLPKIDGSGLVLAELFAINKARTNAAVNHAILHPEADASEIEGAGRAAATAELVRVLRGRPAAPPLSPMGETPSPRPFVPSQSDVEWLCLQEAAGGFELKPISGGSPGDDEPSDLDHFLDELMPEPSAPELSDDWNGAAFGHDIVDGCF